MDRSLVLVKQRRSHPADGTSIVRSLANAAAHRLSCSASAGYLPGCVRTWRMGVRAPHGGYVGHRSLAEAWRASAQNGGSDPVAGPTKPVRQNYTLEMAGALRDRLHVRPLVLRAPPTLA